MNWREEVIFRDGGCVAPLLDAKAGLCYDEWGSMLSISNGSCEADYVRLGHKGKRHELPEDHVCVCAGHHRGAGPHAGFQWATANRALLREYLEACYALPEARRRGRGWGRVVSYVLRRRP